MLKLVVVLSLMWAVTVFYGEMLAFWLPSLWSCSWPQPPLNFANKLQIADIVYREQYINIYPPITGQTNEVGYQVDPVKIAVLADPQLMDKTSHGLTPGSLALEISQFYADLFMRRAFFASIMPFEPDVILFLGDYFDGGAILSDEEWQESLSRFKHIFNMDVLSKKKNIQVHYLPGNHDVGYASFLSHRPEVAVRYQKEFGKRNYRFAVGNVEFIAIDAQTIDGHLDGSLASATWDFVKNISLDVRLYPRVLLTHIPLYRPDWTSCGPYRYSPIINQRVSRSIHDQEITYQNYISKEASDYLLDLIRPVLVLSGHDHDQCTVVHMSKDGPVLEHTVGTLSWQQGNLYPSFMLLTANNVTLSNASNQADAISSRLCFLPMQTHIYLWYIGFYLLTLLIGLLWPANTMGLWKKYSDFMGYARSLTSKNIFKNGTKEKDEDENYEYEMLWDAEGSLHLVKKTTMPPIKTTHESGSLERGSVAMRPAAKKHISGSDASLTMDMDVDVESDSIARLPQRAAKARTKKVIHRLVRTFQLLIIIAALNIPLYMMLLFKDWSDQ